MLGLKAGNRIHPHARYSTDEGGTLDKKKGPKEMKKREKTKYIIKYIISSKGNKQKGKAQRKWGKNMGGLRGEKCTN